MPILRQIQRPQQDTAQEIEPLHQISPPIVPVLRRNVRKHIVINSLSEQRGSGPGRRSNLPNLLPDSINDHVAQRQKSSKSCIMSLSSAVYGLCLADFLSIN